MKKVHEKIKEITNKISSNMHYKLLITIVIFVILLLVVILSVSFYFSTNDTKEEMRVSNFSSMEMAKSYMDEKINDYDELLTSMLFDEDFKKSFLEAQDESINFSNQQYIEDKLFSIYNSNPSNIEQVSVYTNWNEREVSLLGYQTYIHYNNEAWKELSYEKKSKFETDNAVFILKKHVKRFETREIIGGLSIEVNWNAMHNVFSMLKDRKESTLLLVNGRGEAIHNPFGDQVVDKKISEHLYSVDDIAAQNYIEFDSHYLFIQPINEDLYITKFIPKNVVLESGNTIVKIGIVIGVVSIVMLMVFSAFFYMKVTKPIKDLASEMNQISLQNFQTTMKVDQTRNDEIWSLQHNFVTMIEKIKQLIEEEYKHELDKQTAQYQALQNKINPHFLHNSLQVMGSMALSNKGKDVYTLIDSLSKMFRYTLRANKDIATIKEEAEHLKQYLFIQKQRFKEKLEIDIYMDEDVKDSTLPILTLQPIVENAFSHAFTTDKEKWQLHVSIENVLDEIEIKVIDNGKGMDDITKNEMNHIFAEDSKDLYYVRKSMGLKNVNNRLKLIYGKEYGLQIISEKDKGTEVIIRIPSIKKEEDV